MPVDRNSEQNLPPMYEFIYFLKKSHLSIEELFRPVRLFFLENVSPCTVIKDCTFIRDVRVAKGLTYLVVES